MNQSDLKKASLEIDVRRIHEDLAQIALLSPLERKQQKVLDYLLSLTQGRAAFIWRIGKNDQVEVISKSVRISVQEAPTVDRLVALSKESMAKAPRPWKAGVLRFEEIPDHWRVLFTPVALTGREVGLCCLVLSCREKKQIGPFLVILQLVMTVLGGEAPSSVEREWAFEKTAALVEIITRVGELDEYEHACQMLVHYLQEYFGAYRVALGFSRQGGMEIAALSGVTDLAQRGSLSLSLASVMKEALSIGERVEWPHSGEGDIQIVSHEELCHSMELSKVVSIPLMSEEGKARGALTILWQKSEEGDSQLQRLIQAAEPPLKGLAGLLFRAKPSWIHQQFLTPWRRLSRHKKQLAIYGSIALFLILIWPVHYPVKANVQLEPVIRRVIAAPFDSLLQETVVKPGEVVEKKALLAKLDGKELRSKLAELIAARSRARKQAESALAQSNIADAQIAQLEADSLQYEIEILQDRLHHLEIRTPIEGIIIAGDLERAQGVPVRKGQTLFEVAPLHEMIAEIQIPEREIAFVRQGQKVFLRLHSFPSETLYSRVKSIHPKSELRDGSNVFVAEAFFSNKDQKLRPGMFGKATVEADRKPLFWILFHRLWEFIELKLFW